MKIKINILFWGIEQERMANTKLSWLYLKDFCGYAETKGLNIEPYLFDFSEENILINEAIHIPYPNTEYKRAEKINKVIGYHGDEEYMFSIMDSDVIINTKDYDSLIRDIKGYKNNEFYVFRVSDVQSLNGVDFDHDHIVFENIDSVDRNFDPDGGGLIFVDIKILKEVGGFDERFKIWSCEDNEISYRMQERGYSKVVSDIVPYHLPHKHALKDSDREEYNKQVHILFNEKRP